MVEMPDSGRVYPVAGQERVVLLRSVVESPLIDVGNDVWFGYNTLVMPGVRIGHGTIVASGSVVVDDVPDYGVGGGNPAKLVRARFQPDDVDRLLAIAWWHWPIELIAEHVRTIMSGDIDALEQARR